MVAVLAGIDEAGYGPVLGPLVVTGVAFHLPDAALDDCLWRRLELSVTRRASKRDHRLPIVDSKKLFHRKTGLKKLERTALVMASVAGIEPKSGRAWLAEIAPGCVDAQRRHPWYRDHTWTLPLENDAAAVAAGANAIRRDLSAQGMRFLGVFCEPLLEGDFNRVVAATRNKSVASLGQVLRIAHRIARVAGSEPVRICVDRQGGRQHYGPSLMTAFDGHRLGIEEESERRSAYRLEDGGRALRIEFQTGGEDAQLPVALASIFCKYVRELFMIALNRYWAERVAGLRPTAGYYQDAQRFLSDIGPAVERAGFSRSLLVRSR